MESKSKIRVEVAYALSDRQEIIQLEVETGCTAFEAARLSGITTRFPGITLESAKMGIFAKALDGIVLPSPKTYQLQPEDRVEIYRPLLVDPKEARVLRAQKAREKKAAS